jgi:soluble lytic murein transglycosylase
LRLRLEQAAPEEVEAFFVRHPGEYLAEVMRHEWLRILARRADWSNFARHYAALVSTLVNDEPDVLCYGLQLAPSGRRHDGAVRGAGALAGGA